MFNLRIYRYNIGLVIILFIYLFAILLLFCFRIIILDSDQDNLALVLGLISIGVSILSLMLASQSYIKFEGKINCWNVAKNEYVRELGYFNHGTFKEINFEINNYNKKVIRGLFISIRHPKNLKSGKKTENFDIYDYKETSVLSNSKIKFLGNSNGDCTFPVSIYLKDIELNKGKIFISVSGDNIDTTTFRIDKELFEKIKSSNSTKKFSLPKA